MDSYNNQVEEFEIQLILGDNTALFEACGTDQSNLNIWFGDIGCLQGNERVNLYFLVRCAGYTLSNDLINSMSHT